MIGCKARNEGFIWGRDGIIHDAEHRLAGLPNFMIDELDDSTFQDIFQSGVIPLSFIEEMCSRGTVAGAVFFKVDRFPMTSGREYRDQNSHDMFHDSMGGKCGTDLVLKSRFEWYILFCIKHHPLQVLFSLQKQYTPEKA